MWLAEADISDQEGAMDEKEVEMRMFTFEKYKELGGIAVASVKSTLVTGTTRSKRMLKRRIWSLCSIVSATFVTCATTTFPRSRNLYFIY